MLFCRHQVNWEQTLNGSRFQPAITGTAFIGVAAP